MTDKIFIEAYNDAAAKVERNSGRIGLAFPQAVPDGEREYNREEPDYWTGGFWGGQLWLAYRALKKEPLRELARAIEEAQDVPLNEFTKLHHDVGFMWLPTAVLDYRLTGREESRVRGLKAAAILASRFNLNGRFIRAWNEENRENSQGLAIIDCLMNLPLLY
ncbi:MAG: glycosyl hydrolase, partial [Hungatella sp.]